jgi:hypothetical protein
MYGCCSSRYLKQLQLQRRMLHTHIQYQLRLSSRPLQLLALLRQPRLAEDTACSCCLMPAYLLQLQRLPFHSSLLFLQVQDMQTRRLRVLLRVAVQSC